MTQDEIVKMAREAGLVRTGDKWVEPARWGVTELVHFSNLVAAAARAEENEACAKACDEREEIFQKYYTKGLPALCASAIRARSEKLT